MTKRSETDAAISQGESGSDDTARKLPLPSDSPATNLLIADIIVRGASSLFRRNVEKRVEAASKTSDEAKDQPPDGRTILTTLGLYGAGKLASRSVPGLMLVTGGLIAKTLYERGKAVQLRKHREDNSSKPGDPPEDQG